MTIGIDTSRANSYCGFIIGEACGQVFEARDTVLVAVSVWRLPLPNATPLRLYVLEVDSTGTPDVNRILRIGPTVQIVVGDSIHPVQFRFTLDPPLVLPRPGHYEFAVQPAPPYCDFGASLLADDRDPYPGGAAWKHHRSFPEFDCPLEITRVPTPGDDLIFTVEFCDTTTPVRRSSWGSLKTRYR